MPALNNFLREIRMLLNCLTYHVGRDFDANPVPQIEQARNAFLETIVIPFLRGQIGILRIERWKGAASSSFGLGAGFELHGDGND